MASRETIDTDIVVIGAGGSGLTAAVAAAEKGAKVVVLEKRRAAGGTTAMAEGMFAAESFIQKRSGIDADKDNLFKVAMEWSHWRTDPRIIRAYIDKSADTIQWLADKGVILDYLVNVRMNQLRTWHCHPKFAGPQVIKALCRDCDNLGVQILFQTVAKKISLNEKGEVTVILTSSNQNERKINAKCVIIGTGGYGGNKELLRKYYPHFSEDMGLSPIPNMGDGILLATKIGAAIEGMGTLMSVGPLPISPHSKSARMPHRIDKMVSEPNTIWVNKNGERFVDEGHELWAVTANAVRRQPDGICYSLFDDKIKQTVIEKGTVKGGSLLGRPGVKLTNLENDLYSEANKGTVKITESLNDIAHWIGVAPEILKATINEYNSFCDHGHDEIFAKDRRYLQPLRNPPYYAMLCTTRVLVSFGGIKINPRMEVVNLQNKPIPGLYAVGNDAGGWEWDTYCLELPGFAFGFAVNSGRIAGENAVKYVSSMSLNN